MDITPSLSTLLIKTRRSRPIPTESARREVDLERLDGFLKEAYQIVSDENLSFLREWGHCGAMARHRSRMMVRNQELLPMLRFGIAVSWEHRRAALC
jgi:hypothetical protein